MARAGARPWAAPACRRARWCGPRCGRGQKRMAERGAPTPDKVTGGFAVPPIPKAALVTGGARRIGRALVLALAADGYAVAIHNHRSGKAAAALAAEIAGNG